MAIFMVQNSGFSGTIGRIVSTFPCKGLNPFANGAPLQGSLLLRLLSRGMLLAESWALAYTVLAEADTVIHPAPD